MSKLFHSAMLSAFMVTAAMPAFAQTQRVRVGGITCVAGPRAGLVLGSRRDLQCVFRSDITGRQYAYAGKIRRIGLDVGITRGGRLYWAVFAPTTHVGRSTLRGSYRGASGNVALGVGVGANMLIGGSRRTVSLQALSVEGQDRDQPGTRRKKSIARIADEVSGWVKFWWRRFASRPRCQVQLRQLVHPEATNA